MSGTNGEYKYLGKPRPLVEGKDKVTGAARYVADVQLPRMLYARPLLSPYAHAKIVEIDKSEAEALDGVIEVLTADDLPTRNRKITSRMSAILAKEIVRWVGQPVVVVVAETDAIATDALDLVFIDYEPLPVVGDIREAIKPDAPQIWPNGLPKEDVDMTALHGDVVKGQEEEEKEKYSNVHAENHFSWGDLEAAFAESEVIIERTYRTNIVHQGYMEPHAVVVDPGPLGESLTIYTSTQGQHSVRSEVSRLLSMPEHKVVVKPMTFGGGFGAKYGIYDPLAASVALAIGQPVRLLLSRSEDFASTMPAPAMYMEVKTGVKKDGTVTGLQAKVFTDNGVFSFNHGGLMATLIGSTYKWQAVQFNTYEVYTHKPPVGAYRAPGAPQSAFAIEGNIDDMAYALGLDLVDFRLQNAVEDGDKTGTGRPLPTHIGLRQCLDVAKAHPLWQNKQAGDGVGIAVGAWPTFMEAAEAICRVDTDGRVRVNVGSVDISGVNSSFVLVAAEMLGVSPDDVDIIGDDTTGAYGPGSGGSKVAYSVSGAVQKAALDVKQQLLEVAAKEFEAAAEDVVIQEGQAHVIGVPDKKISIGDLVKKSRSTIGAGPIVAQAKASPPEAGAAFAVQIVKLNVDEHSGTVTPEKLVTIQDVGFSLNPMMVEGQMMGGAVQSMSMALHEAMVYDEEGQLLTASFMDYSMPRSDNTPELESIMVNNPSPHGPFGMRGVGEPPISAGAAAVAGAIRDVTGVAIDEIPVRAETLWRAMQGK